MSGRLILRLLLVVAALAAAVYGAILFLRPTVLVAPVKRETAAKAAPGTITVLATRTIEVRSEVSGRIAKSHLELGEAVTAGQVLVEIDPTEIEIQIERDMNDVVAAQRRVEIGPTLNAEMQNARDDLKLREEMFKAGSIGELEQARAQRAVAQLEQRIELEKVDLQQRLDTLESTLALNRHKLSLMTIRSPIDGVVSNVTAGVGDLVNSGSNIARITAKARIVEARVSEENFAGVKVGQRATVRFNQFGVDLYNATVAKILPEADPLTQRYRVHLEVAIEPERLVPGITGDSSITLAERPDALVIPRTALLGDSVFVVKDDRIVLRKVEAGFTDLNLVEIVKGLEEGDLVVIEELDRLRDADRVRVRLASDGGAS